MSDDVTFYDEIEAYCGRLSYRPGQIAELHVSTKHDRYNVSVHRWGSEQQLVWQADNQAASYTPPPPDADANGCRWPVSIEIPVDAEWRSGFYLVTVAVEPTGGPAADVATTPDRSTAHACFVVTAQPTRANRALLVLATNTWNAYNTWGGKSLYTGGKHVSFRRPFGRGMLSRPEVDRDDRKARPARWGEEHDINGDQFQAYRFANGYPASIGSSGWFSHERRFVEWAEAAGYHFDYCISSDLDDDPGILDDYDLFIDVGHDEYWSAGQRETVERFVANGGNFASMSGNTMFWQVRLQAAEDAGTSTATSTSTGTATGAVDDGATMVCHKYTAHETDPVVAAGSPADMSGLWCDPLVGRPEWSLLGAGSAWGLYNRFGLATPRGSGAFTVYRNQHWMFAGTELRYGDLLGATHGAVGYETVGCRLDFDDYQLPIARADETMPSDIEIVAFTPSSNVGVGEYPASISALSDQGDLEFIASRLFGGVDEDSLARCRYGNAVMSVCRPNGGDGGEVVVVGTTDWVFGLEGDAHVVQVTKNILDRFLG